VHFHGPVTTDQQAIGFGHATQDVKQILTSEIESLKKVKKILSDSEELKVREVRLFSQTIDQVTEELGKPEQPRNWKNLLDWANRILETAKNATDMAKSLGPYLPVA
jgi:hypothetical protein